MSAGTHKGQRKESDPLELESQEVVSHPVGMLGTGLRFSGRVPCALNCQTTSPVHCFENSYPRTF